jgi:hypothetical protein
MSGLPPGDDTVRTVLVVGQSPARPQLLTLAEGLVRNGHEVELTLDHAHAMRLMQESPQDLVVVDTDVVLANADLLDHALSGRRPRTLILGSPAHVQELVHRTSKGNSAASVTRE